MNHKLSVLEIWQENYTQMGIKWSDHSQNLYDTAELRKRCPCAVCRKKESLHQQRPLLAAQTKISTISSVGNYAIRIEYDDGHKTGIYTWDYLKKIASYKSTH